MRNEMSIQNFKRMIKKILLLTAACLLAVGTVNASKKKTYYRTTVRCLGVELDGSQTLRVTGTGRNRKDAKEQAIKNAVNAVLFDGIKEGSAGCNMRPVVEDIRVKQKNEDFFNHFFIDNGPYTHYISLADTKILSRGKRRTRIGCNYEITIRVLRAELKHDLESKGIIQ